MVVMTVQRLLQKARLANIRAGIHATDEARTAKLGTCIYANGDTYEVRVQTLYHLCVILSH